MFLQILYAIVQIATTTVLLVVVVVIIFMYSTYSIAYSVHSLILAWVWGFGGT
jgi:hypothetical protein